MRRSDLVKPGKPDLAEASPKAVRTLEELLNCQQPSIQRAASRDILTLSIQHKEASDMEQRLAALEERLAGMSNGHAPVRIGRLR